MNRKIYSKLLKRKEINDYMKKYSVIFMLLYMTHLLQKHLMPNETEAMV